MKFEPDDFSFTPGTAAVAGPPKPERDWKRSVLIFGLGVLSWVATYVGMLELIEANMGDLPVIHKLIIAFSVAMLMTMIIWLLDQLFKPHPFLTKVFYASGYVFLSLISIGFGFGFYWKVLESRGEATRSAESAVSQVQNSLHAAATRLEQLNATLVQLSAVSTAKAELERTKGTSCPNSKPGDGPRRKMREEDAQRFNFASEFVQGRAGAVKGDMTALNGDLAKIASADASTFDAKTGTRNEFMRALGRKLDMTVTGFNAFRTDPQLRQIRSELADRAERTTFGDPKGGLVSCPDGQLQTALRGAVKAIDQLPELEKPEIAAVEGSEATIEAFRRLTTTFYGALAFKMPPSADELRDLQKKAVQSVESPAPGQQRQWTADQGGLSKRDYVPLAVALFVDLCLFLVSMVQRPAGRLDGMLPKMQAAERGPVIQILSRFNDIHRDKQIRENFEIFRHVVFDMNGDYYVAVPLDAPPRLNPKEREELRVEAQLLSNLFASFEKEKIFKRTMLPTTASIKKRLARQGSKFAAAEAFRVYKFTDGAWSDIILGAVMGAARRSEQDKRVTERPAPLAQETLAITPEVTDKTEPVTQRPAVSVLTTPRRPAAPPAYTQSPSVAPDPEHVSRFGPYAEVYQPGHRPVAAAPQAPRVQRSAPPPLPEADVTVKAANSNTAPAANTFMAAVEARLAAAATGAASLQHDDATVVRLQQTLDDSAGSQPDAQMRANAPMRPGASMMPGAPMIDVTLSRETATFSVPVSEAVVPSAMKSAFARAQMIATAQAIEPGPSQDFGRSGRLSDRRDPVNDDFTAADMALIGRMAPPAAE